MNYEARSRGDDTVLDLPDSYRDEAILSPGSGGVTMWRVAAAPALVDVPRSRYGEKRGVNLIAIIVTAALHVALLAAALYVRYEALPAEKEMQLTVVDLTPPPPPPAPETPPSPPQIVAPAPPILVPRPPTVVVTPDPVPQEKTLIAAPAPAPAPPMVAPSPPSVVQGADLSARMVSGAPPRYPVESRRKREQGTVLLLLTLDTEGRVSSISIARSSGFERLDNAALSAVRKWRWAPLIRDGKPVMVKGSVEIPFILVA